MQLIQSFFIGGADKHTACETQSVTGEEDVGRSVQQRASNYETSATAAVFRRLHGRTRN